MTSEEREYIIEKRELYEDILKKTDKIIMVTAIVGIGGAVLQEVAPGILNADAYSTACQILEPVKKLGFGGLFTSLFVSLKYIGRTSELNDILITFKEDNTEQSQDIEKEGKSR